LNLPLRKIAIALFFPPRLIPRALMVHFDSREGVAMATRFLATLSALGWLTVAGAAKAPNAPTSPQTEFKVLPSLAQEFFGNDAPSTQSAITPVIEVAQPADAFAAMGGSAIGFAWTCRK
jgi:hypothetical protein